MGRHGTPHEHAGKVLGIGLALPVGMENNAAESEMRKLLARAMGLRADALIALRDACAKELTHNAKEHQCFEDGGSAGGLSLGWDMAELAHAVARHTHRVLALTHACYQLENLPKEGA